MPVVSRIDWITRQIAMGRRVHIHFGRLDRDDRAKIEVILDSASSGQISPIVATSVQCALASVTQLAQNFPATDRGHKHSNGVSEISIWISHAERCQPARQCFQSGPAAADAAITRTHENEAVTGINIDADSERSISEIQAPWEQELDEQVAVHGRIGGGSCGESVSDHADWECKLDEYEGVHGTIGGGDDDGDQQSEYQPAPWEQTSDYLRWEEEVLDQMSDHSRDEAEVSESL